MKRPQPPSESDPQAQLQKLEQEIEQQLEELEQNLTTFKARYNQVKHDRKLQLQLTQRSSELNKIPGKSKLREIKQELETIQEQLEILEVQLESQLFSWNSLKEPFWQAVRFGGLGVVVGWILKSCAS